MTFDTTRDSTNDSTTSVSNNNVINGTVLAIPSQTVKTPALPTMALTEEQAFVIADAWQSHEASARVAIANTTDFLRQSLALFTSEDAKKREKGERLVLIIWGENKTPISASIRSILNTLGKEEFAEVTGEAGFTVKNRRVIIAKKRNTSKKCTILVDLAKEISDDIMDEKTLQRLAEILAEAANNV